MSKKLTRQAKRTGKRAEVYTSNCWITGRMKGANKQPCGLKETAVFMSKVGKTQNM